MKNKKTIWFDITNVPHVNFFLPIINKYEGEYNFIFTIRDFAETKGLFEKKINKPYKIVGKHKGGNKFNKVFGSFQRLFQLLFIVPKFDVKISCGGDASNIVAKLRGKKSITFDDNEKAPNWRYSPFSDFAFWPKCVSKEELYKQFFKEHKLYQYNGFKEDMYLADYKPDITFLKTLPFDNYVVVRPENINANYVSGNATIVPELLEELSKKNINVLYLPRYEHDRAYALNYNNIFIPKGAVNGLDACYFSDAVLTGAGTMAREAACLGVPAVSFYTGKELLTVDEKLIQGNKMFFSRQVDEIINYYDQAVKGKQNLQRCIEVRKEIIEQLDHVLKRFNI